MNILKSTKGSNIKNNRFKHLTFTILFLVFTITFSSCKTTKTTTSNSAITSLSSKKIISNHYKNSFDKKTISGTIKASFKDKKRAQSINLKFRSKKNESIWMSARVLGFPVAKILITPTRVQFYEKLGKQYFDGNFSLLSDFLGTEVDFEMVENLLVGQAVLNLKDQKYDSEITNNLYVLEPKKQAKLYDLLFWIHPGTFKINKQEISQSSNQKKLTVTYPEYQNVQGIVFPKKINIRAVEKTDVTLLNLEYRSVEFNQDLSFPFKIPSGYKKIKIK